MTKGRLAIVGASTLGQQLLGHAMSIGGFRFVGFFDDFAPHSNSIIGRTTDILQRYNNGLFDCLAIGVGYKVMNFRHKMLESCRGIIPLASIVHEQAVVDKTAVIDEGCVLLANVVVDQRVKIGPNCFLSLAATVSHDTTIGASSYLSPKVTVCGNCDVGKRVFLGAGCVIRDGTSICDDVVVGCGAVVVDDITEPGTYVGIPSRRIA